MYSGLFLYFFSGVVNLEMCDALIKMAIYVGCKGVDSYKDISPQPMPLPVIIETAKVYLQNATQIFQHEDPGGPEAGG